MDNRFSILLLGTQMATGGAQKGLLDHARCFKRRGCKVTVVFFYDKEGLHDQWQRSVDFPIHDLRAYGPGADGLRQLVNLIKGILRLWKLLRRERFDVVETFTPDSNLLGLPFAWLAGIPVRIATHRGTIEGFSRWRQILHSWMINIGIADTLVAVSEMTRQKAIEEGTRADRIRVIQNGITPLDASSINRIKVREELGLSEDDLFLVSIGRLVYQKGHEYLVRAMPDVIRKYPNAKVGIFGEGPLRSQLESQIAELGLSDHIKLYGIWNDIAPVLAIADVFILPSRWEGLSRALLEAMAAGLPVIATRVEGVEEVITDGVHGLLIPSEDSDALKDSILELIGDSEMRKRLGAAARADILRSHSTDEMCKRYNDLMLSCLEKKKPVRK